MERDRIVTHSHSRLAAAFPSLLDYVQRLRLDAADESAWWRRLVEESDFASAMLAIVEEK